MKRRRRILILLGLLVVCGVVTLIVTQVQENQEKIKNTDEIILSVEPDTVDTLSWDNGTTSVSLTKTDDVWNWDEDSAFPVDEEKVNDLLSIFEEFGAAFVIEDVEDLSVYGLSDPTATIDFTADGESYEILLGDYSKMDSQRYVSIGDGKVYLVSTDPSDTFSVTADDLLKDDEIPSMKDISEITFSGSENYTLIYSEENEVTYDENDHYFTTIDGAQAAADTDRVSDYISQITGMSLSDYASYNVTDEELTAWGMDDPALTITVKYTPADDSDNNSDSETEETFVLSIGENREEAAARAAAEEKDEEYDGTVTAYARIGDSQIVYTITNSKYKNLAAASYNDLRHEEVLNADFSKVSKIDLNLDDCDYTITADIGKKETTYTLADEEIEIDDLQSAVESLAITEFTDEKPEGKKEISMTFTLDLEGSPQVQIDIYRNDGSTCLVTLDGKTLGYADRAAVVDLIEAVNSLVL